VRPSDARASLRLTVPLKTITADAHHDRPDGVANGDGTLTADADGIAFVQPTGTTTFTHLGARSATYAYPWAEIIAFGHKERRTTGRTFHDVLIDTASEGRALFSFYPAEAAGLLLLMLRRHVPDVERAMT
jgi:hypothetical protein